MYVCGIFHQTWSNQPFWLLPTEQSKETYFWDVAIHTAYSTTHNDMIMMMSNRKLMVNLVLSIEVTPKHWVSRGSVETSNDED